MGVDFATMSEFETNPFVDPNADPFGDQSVAQARGSQRADGYDEYNPFAKDQFNAKTQQPAVLSPSNEPPPYTVPASSSAAVSAATEDLRRRQEELDRKAEELERRERDMQRTSHEQQGVANNFPPLPSFCPVKPCFYQDFVVDIPSQFQRIVKVLYYLWISYVCLLFINLIASLTYFITLTTTTAGTTFGLSIAYFFMYTPCSFICWYRPVYKAFRSDSSVNFFIFFFVFFCQGCTCVVQCLGILGSGTVGWIAGFQVLGTNKGVGVFMLVVACLFTLMAIACFLLLIRVHRLYRSTGASFDKARDEFRHGVVTNETVQQTATGVASAAAAGAVNQYGSGGSNANRY